MEIVPDLIQHGLVLVQLFLMLVVIADVNARTEANGACIGLLLADNALEQRRFSHAVVADERDAVAGAQVHMDVLEQLTTVKAL